MAWHPTERAALADALEAAGPGAPTLCEGWQTEHLAAHVVLRETSPGVAAGIGLPFLADRTEQKTRELGDASATPDGYAALVARVRGGVPPWYPMSLLGDAAQLVELHVHAEDARRGAGTPVEPRPLSPAHADALWARLRLMGRLLYAKAGPAVSLVREDTGAEALVTRTRGGSETGERPWVRLRGPVSDLLLHAHGRGLAARVAVEGSSPEAVAALDARHPRRVAS